MSRPTREQVRTLEGLLMQRQGERDEAIREGDRVAGRLYYAERERDEAVETLAIEQRAHGTAQARSAREAAALRERLSDALTLLDEARALVRDLSPVVRWDEVARAALEDPGAACLSGDTGAGAAVSGGFPSRAGERT